MGFLWWDIKAASASVAVCTLTFGWRRRGSAPIMNRSARRMATHARLTATVVRNIALRGCAASPARIMATHARITASVVRDIAMGGTAAAAINIVISSIVLNLL